MPPRIKRGYSRAFTPHTPGSAKRYMIDKIPAGLWAAVRLQAKRDGISVRALILTLLTEYLDRTRIAPAAGIAPAVSAAPDGCQVCGRDSVDPICAECVEDANNRATEVRQ